MVHTHMVSQVDKLKLLSILINVVCTRMLHSFNTETSEFLDSLLKAVPRSEIFRTEWLQNEVAPLPCPAYTRAHANTYEHARQVLRVAFPLLLEFLVVFKHQVPPTSNPTRPSCAPRPPTHSHTHGLLVQSSRVPPSGRPHLLSAPYSPWPTHLLDGASPN